MKLNYLHLAEVKQFRRPLHLDDLADGINLFVGPNESGKSTLVDAIRAAFFERYKSGSVDYLQPWGDSSGATEVELAFDWQGECWVLNKRFLNRPRCDLKVGTEHFSDTDAEDKLAELFGYQFALKGASKAEHQGIPGLLWVHQGAIQNMREPVTFAGDRLKSALGSNLGEVASSSGDELIAVVEKARSQWLTPKGKPTGDYSKVMNACIDGQEKLAELNQQIDAYRQQVDELDRLRQQQQETDRPRPWEGQRKLARDAETRLGEVRTWQAQQQQDAKDLKACSDNQEIYRQQLQNFEAEVGQLQQRERDKEKTQAALHACQHRKPQLDAQHREALASYETAKATRAQARQQANRERVQNDHGALAAVLAANKKTMTEARKLQNELAALREQHQVNAIDADALEELKQLGRNLGDLKIRRESLATRLQYDLLQDKTLAVGVESVTGKGERLLLETTELTIPGVGNLRLQPGGTDVAELAREQQSVQGEYDALLRQLGIPSLDVGEQRAATSQQLNNEIGRKNSRLEGLASDGVDALAEQCRLDGKRLGTLAEQLAALPEASGGVLDEATAEADLETAHNKLKAVEEAVHAHASELGLAKQALTTANDEWQKLKSELESPQHNKRKQDASHQLTDLKAQATRLEADTQARQRKIDAAQPDVLEQDMKRHTDSGNAMEDEANRRKRDIDRLEVVLQTLGAQGLDEKRDTLQQEVEASERRRDELTRRTAALDLLLELLKDKRQALTRQLQAPLQKHLDHYLKLLFPHASLTVDENLMPQMLTRQPTAVMENGDVDNLSYGTREQMGLISRLAYADLLREAGKPTLIILDDALVHSDTDRLGQMKRILFDAATRHQVLLFSCHPDNWRDLGVPARDLQTLKAAAV